MNLVCYRHFKSEAFPGCSEENVQIPSDKLLELKGRNSDRTGDQIPSAKSW